MCGIFGLTNGSRVTNTLLDGLRNLEYRGYDSAGIATLQDGAIIHRRVQGKLANLVALLERDPLDGATGIAHTRWATHGQPSARNAHPHVTERVAVVHNGIVENHRELRRRLSDLGYRFCSETDSEVIPVLITHYLDQGMDGPAAVRTALSELQGTYAIGAIIADEDDRLYAARRGSPLVLGLTERATFLASDALAIGTLAEKVVYLEDGDCAVLSKDEVVITNTNGDPVSREAKPPRSQAVSDRAGFQHYMLKEIHEQPAAIRNTLQQLAVEDPGLDFADVSRLSLIACGTSYYAALLGRYWFEELADLPTEVEIASEFRYRHTPFRTDGAALFISQSGETADTLAALRHARGRGSRVGAIVNVENSSIAREADFVFHTGAGPEIGVASTKAFTAQIAVLAHLAVRAGRQRGHLDPTGAEALLRHLQNLPHAIQAVLERDSAFAAIAAELQGASHVLYLGRGTCYPIALEGALKLKEISYIHTEGYAAGEMKHGPIALVDDRTPVVILAPPGELFEKTASNLREITARSGRAFVITDAAGAEALADDVTRVAIMPEVQPLQVPFAYALPVQLIAYHAALLRGNDVDQPRNLAKSVTVE